MRRSFSQSAAGQRMQGERPAGGRARSKVLLGAIIGIGLAAFSGCSSSATIDGTVNRDGGPLEYGSIAFEPKDSTQRKVVATIDQGHFQANEVSKGPSVIRICVGERPKGRSGSLVGSAPTGTLVEISKSEKDISGGSQTLKFNLKGG